MKVLLGLLVGLFSFAAKADLDTCCYYAKKNIFGQSTCSDSFSMEEKFRRQVEKNYRKHNHNTFLKTSRINRGCLILPNAKRRPKTEF